MKDLPNELVLNILTRLPISHLKRASSVNRKFQEIASELIWWEPAIKPRTIRLDATECNQLTMAKLSELPIRCLKLSHFHSSCFTHQQQMIDLIKNVCKLREFQLDSSEHFSVDEVKCFFQLPVSLLNTDVFFESCLTPGIFIEFLSQLKDVLELIISSPLHRKLTIEDWRCLVTFPLAEVHMCISDSIKNNFKEYDQLAKQIPIPSRNSLRCKNTTRTIFKIQDSFNIKHRFTPDMLMELQNIRISALSLSMLDRIRHSISEYVSVLEQYAQNPLLEINQAHFNIFPASLGLLFRFSVSSFDLGCLQLPISPGSEIEEEFVTLIMEKLSRNPFEILAETWSVLEDWSPLSLERILDCGIEIEILGRKYYC